MIDLSCLPDFPIPFILLSLERLCFAWWLCYDFCGHLSAWCVIEGTGLQRQCVGSCGGSFFTACCVFQWQLCIGSDRRKMHRWEPRNPPDSSMRVTHPKLSFKSNEDKCNIYFTNFPDEWETCHFWNIFKAYGDVIDVHIPGKKILKGKDSVLFASCLLMI